MDLQGTNYEIYRLSKKEWLSFGGQGIGLVSLICYVCYRSFWVFVFLLPVGLGYPLLIRKELKRKRLERLRSQFKDAILAAASCLHAGYSVEHAFAEALKEVDQIHGTDSMISEEIRLILRKTRVNRTFEEGLLDLASRSDLTEVKSFAEVFAAARINGGELMKMIAQTAEIIGEKIRLREDLLTATASRRLEFKVMCSVPILIVLYLDLTSPGYFMVLYTTGAGRLIMSGCLLVYLAAVGLARKWLEISL